MKGAVSLWKPLLLLIDSTIGDFLEDLLTAILDTLKLAESDPEEVVDEETNNALLYWATEILIGMSSSEKPPYTTGMDLEEIAEQCLVQPNRW